MSQLIVLSDAELDVVSGGILNGGAGGNGGNGGAAATGAVVSLSDAHMGARTINLSTNNSNANANGGNGGNGGAVNITVRLGGR